MASITTVRAILTAIKNAPHSISAVDVARANGVPPTIDEIINVLGQLTEAGYIKMNRDYPGTYFTRKPKRVAIQAFIQGSTVLPGVTFDAPVWVTPSYNERIIKAHLSRLRQSPHHCGLFLNLGDNWASINFLKEKGVIKEAKGHSGSFFVKKNNRAVVDAYLAGTATFQDVLNTAADVPTATTAPIPGATHAALLNTLRTAPHAVQVPTSTVLTDLVNNEIVKEHRDKPGFYFVRKTKRQIVDGFLDGSLTIGELLATQSAQDDLRAKCDQCRVEQATEDLFNSLADEFCASAPSAEMTVADRLQAIREHVDAINAALGF